MATKKRPVPPDATAISPNLLIPAHCRQQFLPRSGPATKKAGLKILIVEDTPSDLKLAQLVLESSGHLVEGTDAAERALQAVKEDRPQIILLDLMLPGIDGLAFARMLKADPDTRDIQIVAVTS